MIVLYILAGLLILILILLCIPVQIEAKYSEQLSLKIKYLFIPFQIMPKKEKKAKVYPKSRFGRFAAHIWKKYFAPYCDSAKQKIKQVRAWIRKKIRTHRRPVQQAVNAQKDKKAEKSSFAQLREARGFSGMIALLWRVVSLANGAFHKILKGIAVQRFNFTAFIGGDDAADVAVSYGKWCAVLYPALAFILGETRRYSKNINISPDFSGGATRVDTDLLLRVFPISLLLHSGGALLKLLFLEIKDAVKQKMADASASASFNIKQGGAL